MNSIKNFYPKHVDMKPNYNHDCDKCIFLGMIKSVSEDNTVEKFDVFICDTINKSLVVIGKEDTDGDYTSYSERSWFDILISEDSDAKWLICTLYRIGCINVKFTISNPKEFYED
jgi:hypothetical protein